MAWDQLEPTVPHLTYLILAGFLVCYALFSSFIRNNLHLSEPPLATLVGIIFGPKGAGFMSPMQWGLDDRFVQEYTRVIMGIQCFAVGLELPKHWFSKRRNLVTLAWLLGPVMTFGWLICAVFVHALFPVGWPTSLVVSACLTPTDPVLAASILTNSHFASRVPPRLRHILAAESGCNDGISFPFLYVGLSILTRATFGEAVKKWVLLTILWQCALGTVIGALLGYVANRCLRFSSGKGMIDRAAFVVFYLLLALFGIGIASTLGVDDFLLTFTAGAVFSSDGWFAKATKESNLAGIVDMILNSFWFVYFGASVPWDDFSRSWHGPTGGQLFLSPGRLLALLALVLAFRRIPAVLSLQKFMPCVKGWSEALFAGHFGPMGVGALFLAMEARAQLESDKSTPMPEPPPDGDLPGKRWRGVEIVWPVICFIVLGSIFVHGLSTLFISIALSLKRPAGERAPLLGTESDRLDGMVFSGSEED